MVLKTHILTFDSFYSTYANGGSNTFNTSYIIPNPIKNVKKIKLKSLEMVTTYNTFRASNGTNTMSVIINGITYTITIAELSYLTSSALLTAINAAYSGPISMVLSFDTTYINRIRVTLGSATTFQIVNGPLSNKILGFTSNQSSSATTTFLANGPYNSSVDIYLLMYLKNIPYKTSNYNLNGQFKIPVNADADQIYYYHENLTYIQEIETNSDHFTLNDLQVQFYDRFNCLVSCYTDYSFALEVTYDE